ncbi:unnamed protein product [Periconia digitata]|uniref:Uncharacterized protein n=1 Tax=Periconia digitata TaxID=1303443 RepID=A0A9W4URU0_9PLEO|nr:unnamed protein product [Periconia digitata]
MILHCPSPPSIHRSTPRVCNVRAQPHPRLKNPTRYMSSLYCIDNVRREAPPHSHSSADFPPPQEQKSLESSWGIRRFSWRNGCVRMEVPIAAVG